MERKKLTRRGVLGGVLGFGSVGLIAVETAHSSGVRAGEVKQIYTEAAAKEKAKTAVVRSQIERLKRQFEENDRYFKDPSSQVLRLTE